MRAEDKQLEGPELEREQRVEPAERERDALPVLAGDEVRDIALDHRSRLLDALQLILAREQINISLLYLPQREAHALEALRTAVTGADSVGEFVFAEDRRSLLEQALAVLQQNLTYGEPAQLAELHAKLGSMTEQVSELRGTLAALEDSQEERDEFHLAARWGYANHGGSPPETTAKPSGDTSLDGPERPQPAKPSTLGGPERPQPAVASTLAGPGPAVEQQAAPTTLGDATEIAAAAAKHPWWKRTKRRG